MRREVRDLHVGQVELLQRRQARQPRGHLHLVGPQVQDLQVNEAAQVGVVREAVAIYLHHAEAREVCQLSRQRRNLVAAQHQLGQVGQAAGQQLEQGRRQAGQVVLPQVERHEGGEMHNLGRQVHQDVLGEVKHLQVRQLAELHGRHVRDAHFREDEGDLELAARGGSGERLLALNESRTARVGQPQVVPQAGVVLLEVGQQHRRAGRVHVVAVQVGCRHDLLPHRDGFGVRPRVDALLVRREEERAVLARVNALHQERQKVLVELKRLREEVQQLPHCVQEVRKLVGMVHVALAGRLLHGEVAEVVREMDPLLDDKGRKAADGSVVGVQQDLGNRGHSLLTLEPVAVADDHRVAVQDVFGNLHRPHEQRLHILKPLGGHNAGEPARKLLWRHGPHVVGRAQVANAAERRVQLLHRGQVEEGELAVGVAPQLVGVAALVPRGRVVVHVHKEQLIGGLSLHRRDVQHRLDDQLVLHARGLRHTREILHVCTWSPTACTQHRRLRLLVLPNKHRHAVLEAEARDGVQLLVSDFPRDAQAVGVLCAQRE
mmetsp:Transcript_33003/g.82966  ORF Transcript_33003/g.82966 Transcript_33003/m.82966 type:complete len:546 (-) Transcript_33003:630-2267(-)